PPSFGICMTLPVSETSLGPGDRLSNVSTNVTDRGRGLALKLENVAICHQICVLRRLYHETTEMGTSLQIWSKWRAALTIVQPETVTAWPSQRVFACSGPGSSAGEEGLACRFPRASGFDPTNE